MLESGCIAIMHKVAKWTYIRFVWHMDTPLTAAIQVLLYSYNLGHSNASS